MARLYSNENFMLPVVEALRRSGHDVLTSLEAGRANLGVPDEEVLAFASVEGRAVLRAGVVVCTFNPDFAVMAEKIHTALEPVGRLDRQLLRVNRGA